MPDEPLAKTSLIKNKTFLTGIILAGFVLLIFGLRLFFHAMAYESTDDAFIAGDVIQVSPKIAGEVIHVMVKDNQPVQKGDLLIEIDPRNYDAEAKQAEAKLQEDIAVKRQAGVDLNLTQVTSTAGVKQEFSDVKAAELQVKAKRSELKEAVAALNARQAEAKLAQADLARYQNLFAKDEVSKQQLDQAVANAQTANAIVQAAQAHVKTAFQNLRQAQSQVGQALGQFEKANVIPQQVAESQAKLQAAVQKVKEDSAALQVAQLNLDDAKIEAPISGLVTNKSVEPGDYVQTGQVMLSIVPQAVWVIANYKETQFTKIRPGQPVEIKVDAFPNHIFKGHVESIQSGTGSSFSLFPPENATGNYVKVVQRVPVKIVFDDPIPPQIQLAPGMSVVPEIRIK